MSGDLRLLPGQRIHLIGIAGAGLSAIARILLERGYEVSGADLRANRLTAALEADGATVHLGHQAGHPLGAQAVLASSAVGRDHIEVASAMAAGIPVYKRKDFMSLILGGCDTLAVAGAHGKTTIASMLIHILKRAGKDPSFIVGGELADSGANAGVGCGPSFIIEADEYDNMFLGLRPALALIANVEHDHPDFFATPSDMRAAFRNFAESLAPGGQLVACADDAEALEILKLQRGRGRETTTYSIRGAAADWRAADLRFSLERTRATVIHRGEAAAELALGLPGEHNALNALAAMAMASKRGVPPMESAAALRDFKPTARRFQVRGERDGVIVVDDYGHHPTAIRANIRAARLRYPGHRIWAIWQPHTYSRVQRFWGDFATAFDEADRALITPIYAAREAPLPGVDGRAMTRAIQGRTNACFVATFAKAVEQLRQARDRPTIALIFSAGDANKIADMYLDESD